MQKPGQSWSEYSFPKWYSNPALHTCTTHSDAVPREGAMRREHFGICSVAFAVLGLLAVSAPAAVITVSGTGDAIAVDAAATLREAIISMNNQGDVNADVTGKRLGIYATLPGGTADVINFNIAGSGVRTISATSAEPTIVVPL